MVIKLGKIPQMWYNSWDYLYLEQESIYRI